MQPALTETAMPRDTAESRVDYIARSAEDFFGQELDDISAPGGESRSSFRLHFPTAR
jgi:hypothetical protein